MPEAKAVEDAEGIPDRPGPPRPGEGRRHDRRHRGHQQRGDAHAAGPIARRAPASAGRPSRRWPTGLADTTRASRALSRRRLSNCCRRSRRRIATSMCRSEAIETLGEIGGAAVVAELRKLAGTHAERARARRRHRIAWRKRGARRRDGNVPQGLALAEKSEQVRSEALETLADLRDGAGIAVLIDLAREHPSAATRREALERLLESDHPEARAFFERALRK